MEERERRDERSQPKKNISNIEEVTIVTHYGDTENGVLFVSSWFRVHAFFPNMHGDINMHTCILNTSASFHILYG